jgi:hypothetical protein
MLFINYVSAENEVRFIPALNQPTDRYGLIKMFLKN